MELSDAWHMRKTRKAYWYNPAAWFCNNFRYNWDVTLTWSKAPDQFLYFSSLHDNCVVKIQSKDVIPLAVKLSGVQAGDIMYFVDSSGIIHHATIITKVDGGMIYYAGHTKSRYDYSLAEGIKDDSVFIIKIGG